MAQKNSAGIIADILLRYTTPSFEALTKCCHDVDLICWLNGNKPSVSCTSIDDSVWGHLTCYAVDEAQKRREEVYL